MDYQYIYGNDHCHSTAGTQQNAIPSGTSFWFPVKGFVVVITDFLRTATAVLTTGEMRREKVVERKLVWKNAWIYNMCLPTRGKVCKPSPDWFRRRHLVRLNMLVCDWGIACQEYLFVLALSCVCVCVCVGVHVEVHLWSENLTLFVPRAMSPQPSSTIILIDPHLLQMAPNPDNLSSNFSSLSNLSLSHSVTYWAGLKLPPLSLSYTIITRLTTWNMNTPMSLRQPRKNPSDISWFRRYGNLPLYSEVRTLCQMGRILQQSFQHILQRVKPVKINREKEKYNPCQGKIVSKPG